jgi:phosphate transport system permease protein
MLERKQNTLKSWLASGDLMIWMNAAAVGISIAAVSALLLLIAVKGLSHFWPADVAAITYTSPSGEQQLAVGEIVDSQTVDLEQYREATGDEREFAVDVRTVERWLIKTGNRRLDPPDFMWIYTHRIVDISYPEDIAVVERMEWGNAYGTLTEVRQRTDNDEDSSQDLWSEFYDHLARSNALRTQIEDIEHGQFNAINYEMEQLRLDRRRLALQSDLALPEAQDDLQRREDDLGERYRRAEEQLQLLVTARSRDSIVMELSTGADLEMDMADVVRAWQPNSMSIFNKLGHYVESLGLFLSEPPREANTEGGIFPAIFGTVLMVLLMSVLVTPLGVIAAVYLREYAHQGALVRLIRIAVNNLAGVPSIVYGVFGLGFFVYFIGGSLDELFFTAALPAPTFGTPGGVHRRGFDPNTKINSRRQPGPGGNQSRNPVQGRFARRQSIYPDRCHSCGRQSRRRSRAIDARGCCKTGTNTAPGW